MVNEHYVQQSYLRLFAPNGEGIISRYSLVDKHEGGDYYDPLEEYPIRKAAASQGYADGLLEDDETTRAENAMIHALRGIANDRELSEEDIAHLSQFIVFQRDRSPRSKIFHQLQEEIANTAGVEAERVWERTMHLDASERYEGLQFMGWRVIENKTNVPFITSDIPVVFYQEEPPEGGLEEGFEFKGKEIYCPVSPDMLLVLLDPSKFDTKPQNPRTTIDRIEVNQKKEIWKFNLLQGINALHEVFGPVGRGDMLQRIVEILCDIFPDEDYIRGARWDMDRIIEAQKNGIRNSREEPPKVTLSPDDQEIIMTYSKVSSAIWEISHDISLIDDLRRKDSVEDYWNIED